MIFICGTECHGYIQVINFTKRPVSHIRLDVLVFFLGFRKRQNSSSGGHKTTVFIGKVPFTLRPWISLMGVNTNAK